MQTFKVWLENSCQEERRLWVYRCPQCQKDEAYNGVPGSGRTFRGSAECVNCKHAFSALGKTPVSKEGPLVGEFKLS